jgi:hypothetical protein
MSVGTTLPLICLADLDLIEQYHFADSFADVGFMLAGQPGRIVCAIAYWLCEHRFVTFKGGRRADCIAYRSQT